MFLLIASLIAPSAQADAPASADEGARSPLLGLLSGYEHAPSAATLRSVGPSAGDELMVIAQDPSLSPTQRAGAVYALGYFPTDTHRAYLAALVKDDRADPMLRRKAVFALGNGWGDDALPLLAEALGQPDLQLRAAAARSVGRLGSPAAHTLLRDRLAAEPPGMVRGLIAAGLEAR